MNQPAQNDRTWGFRFVMTDVILIGAVVLAAVFLKRIGTPLWWLLIIVAGHFFLFCNVFRIRRRFELFWAGLFVVNVGGWLFFDKLACANVLLCQLPITLAFVFAEICSPHYHGVLAWRINPRLSDDLERRK